ncbi:glycosyltransferase family 2 protein [Silvibacterium dinghuense]|uniref:glycosyltransferase family 2 protein n=1 Tax=Silvibacterium dinghuense TaxID=1560006 RepID=UPI0013E90AD5|nr:glycosyltransferase family 2 protein [Silvibacterium dinghuense]GGH12413.1 glycosyl transferase [Silvibacterium dinghuense]
MPRFSLVVATYGRTDELRVLLHSLVRQNYPDYELIVVDQNRDDRIAVLLSEFANRVPYRHIVSPPGASRARNAGFMQARGEIVAFPDDDCWYTDGLLANVDQWFRTHEKYDILAVGAIDEEGIASGNRWIQSSCDLRPINIFRTTFCSSLFLRNTPVAREAAFDETIGPGAGTSFGCGDETDFILQLMELGFRGRFDRTWSIGHPRRDMLSSQIVQERAVSYGRGMGRVLRKHSLYSLWLMLAAYDLARAVLVTLRGKIAAAGLCFAHCRGILGGFTAGQPRVMKLGQELNT